MAGRSHWAIHAGCSGPSCQLRSPVLQETHYDEPGQVRKIRLLRQNKPGSQSLNEAALSCNGFACRVHRVEKTYCQQQAVSKA